MASLIETLVNRVQQAATPDRPAPLGRNTSSAMVQPVSRMPVLRAPTGLPIARRVLNPEATEELPEDFIKRALDTIDRQPEKSRNGRAGYLHVTQLIDLCPRAQVLSVLHGLETFKDVTGGHRIMWKFGREIEKHVRDNFIKSRNYADVWGIWKCKCGRTEATGLHSHAAVCPTCKTKLDSYNEITLFDHDNAVSGNPDMPFLQNGRFVITEIKSITGEDFKALEAPLGDHIFQAALYHRLGIKSAMSMYDEVVIFYVSKHFRFGSPYKEYHVDVTAPHIVQIVDDALAMALEVKSHVAARLNPARTLCPNQTCTRAKNCPAANLCFNLP